MRPAPSAHPLPAWRRWAAAWALVAVFGVALAPWISRGLQAAHGAGPLALALTTLCGGSSTGGGAPADDGACALCVLAHAAPLVEATAAPTLALAPLDHVLADAAPAAGIPAAPPWRVRARAPPAIA